MKDHWDRSSEEFSSSKELQMKFDLGDPISDEELSILLKEHRNLSKSLWAFGDRYLLVRLDVERRLRTLESWEQHRKKKPSDRFNSSSKGDRK